MGRPKGALNDRLWRDTLRKIGMEFAEGKSGPRKVELVGRQLYAAAMDGDVTAAREIGDRLDGKPHQTQDVVIEDRRMVEAPPPAPDAGTWQQKYGPH